MSDTHEPDAAATDASRSADPDAPAWPSALLVAVPYVALCVLWVGFLDTMDGDSGLTWLASMWLACLVLLPIAIVGAVLGGRARATHLMAAGIGAAVLCLPGFAMGLITLPAVLHSLTP